MVYLCLEIKKLTTVIFPNCISKPRSDEDRKFNNFTVINVRLRDPEIIPFSFREIRRFA